MPFSSALRNFSVNGYFELTDSQIFLENIRYLDKRINHLKNDQPEIAFYQMNLSNVQLIPGPSPRSEMPEHVLSGAAVEHRSRSWHGRLTDVALVQMGATNGFNAPLNFRDQEESQEQQLAALEGSLLSLLALPYTWNSIELDQVFFYKNHQLDHATTKNFYNDLLNSLAQNESLRELTIKPFSLSKHRKSLVYFLTQHTELEFLHMEIIEANRQDWLELCQILSSHPNLKFFHLDNNSIFDANAYSALANLLDENYRIEMTVPEPTDYALLKVYEPLRQRLSKTGLERFKEDHLTQDSLLQVAFNALEFFQKFKSTVQSKRQVLFKKQFDFLVANEGHLAITSDQKEDWAKSTNILPLIYQNHKEYLKNESSLVQLQMNELVADGSKTIGYVLLEKALETQNQFALESLLNANVNLFEFPDNDEEAFLVNVLQSKGDLKRMVVEYIQQDQRLVALAEEYLDAYPELKNLFKDFKDHLDKYGANLVKKDNPSILLSISKNILFAWRKILDFESPSGTRGKECAQIYLNLDKSLKIIARNPGGATYNSFDEVHNIIIKMKEDSMKAVRGAFNSSFLHEEALELISNFERQLMNVKKKVVNETVKNKDNEIKQLKEGREQERSVFNGKSTQLEAENAEVRAENAAIRAENAAIKKKQMQMEAQLNALTRKMSANTFYSEARSNPSSSQDQTRTETRGFFPS